jgi:hypothetical protein
MQRRDFYFLLPVGITLIAAVIVELLLGGHNPIPIAAPKPVFPGLAGHLDELAWVRVSRGATKVDFANVAGRWVVVEKDNYPAAPARLRRLLDNLAGLTLVEPDASRSAPFDLDSAPAGEPTLIALRGRTGRTIAEAIVAPAPATAEIGDAVYVRQSGAERASLARGSVNMPGDLLGWLDRGIIDLPRSRVASLKLTGADGAVLVIRRNSPDAAFAIMDLPEGARLTGSGDLSDLAGALAGLAFDNVKPLALVELPENGLARAEFATFDGLAIDLRLFAHEGADWIAVAASGSGAAEAESNAINEKLARWIYAIPAARSKQLRTRLDDLTEPAKG